LLPLFLIRRDKRAPLVLFPIAFAIVAVDQLTKLWIRRNLDLGEFVPENGFLRLTYSTNDGIIFGIGAPTVVAIVIPIIVVGLALTLYFWYGPVGGSLLNVSLGLFIGGTVGNWLDRVRYSGLVTDFIDVRLWGDVHWFTFNVADASILVGIILFALLISGLRLRRGTKHQDG
jgi:signal peptidase II